MTTATTSEPTTTAVRAHLADVLSSGEFSGSERRRDLLRFLTEETLEGRADTLKAYTIGTQVLGRATRFDPQADPIVRVEIGRLRSTLDRYYRANPDAPVVITVPKGQYGAQFKSGSRRPTPNPATIAVLPFTDGGSDPRFAYLADGLTEEIGLRLTRTVGLIARTGLPRADYSGRSIREAATDLGTRFVLSGHVLAIDGRVRLFGELFDTDSEETIWADRLETSLDEVHPFEVEDWLVDRVAGRLADGFGVINDRLSASRVPRRAPVAYEAMLRYHHAFSTLTEDPMVAAVTSLQTVAASTEPDARVLAALSDVVFTSWWIGLDEGLGGPERAEDLARRSIAADPELPDAHLVLAYAHFAHSRSGPMEAELERALELDPRGAKTLASAATIFGFDGDLERAVPLAHKAADLNPFLPAWWRSVPALVALRDDDPVLAQTEALQVGTAAGFVGPLLRLTAASALGEATNVDAKELLGLQPDFDLRTEEYTERVFHDPALRSMVLDALADAGVVAA